MATCIATRMRELEEEIMAMADAVAIYRGTEGENTRGYALLVRQLLEAQTQFMRLQRQEWRCVERE